MNSRAALSAKAMRFAVVAAVLGNAFVPLRAAAAVPRCRGVSATIVGTAGRDTIVGTRSRDVIVAKGGADNVRGRRGNDLICGGDGTDSLSGGRGDDRINAGSDQDLPINGNRGDDVLKGGRGANDNFTGGPGNDRFVGDRTADEVSYFHASGGVDVDLSAGVARGQGTDELVNIDNVRGSEFDDTIIGSAGTNWISGNLGSDMLASGGNDARLDTPDALDKADIFLDDSAEDETGGDPDTYIGGGGIEIVDYLAPEGLSTGVTVDLRSGIATAVGTTDSLQNVQGIWGTATDDTIIGDDYDNVFGGDSGDDYLEGGPGEDIVTYSAPSPIHASQGPVSVDLASGSASGMGSDTLVGFEHVIGSFFDDVLVGNEINNRLFARAGDDILDGAGGIDWLDGGRNVDVCINGENVRNCES